MCPISRQMNTQTIKLFILLSQFSLKVYKKSFGETWLKGLSSKPSGNRKVMPNF